MFFVEVGNLSRDVKLRDPRLQDVHDLPEDGIGDCNGFRDKRNLVLSFSRGKLLNKLRCRNKSDGPKLFPEF